MIYFFPPSGRQFVTILSINKTTGRKQKSQLLFRRTHGVKRSRRARFFVGKKEIMKKTDKNLILLNGIFVTSLVISNVMSSKIVALGSLTVPAAVVAYPLTFLMTDVIGEIWGKKEAGHTVRLGFICQVISLLLIALGMALPVAPFADNQAEFSAILGSTFRVTAASMIAYLCSQSWDVWVFHRVRDKYIQRHGSVQGGRWIWNNLSTMTSQMIDTALFILLAFWGTVPNILNMILSQYVVKFVYAALDTIPFYLLTNRRAQSAPTEEEAA